ncbi:MAG: recombinase XerD, partial [Alphaproteobacteria bacterium]|nr:recombinase XerD [Alphaproteobacteria bacterium]
MMAAERGASANTLESYRRDLADFAAALPDGRAPAAADGGDIRSYLAGLLARRRAGTTAARRLSALRQFFRFLLAEGRRGDDPTAAIDSARRARALPKILSEAEVEALLAAAAACEGRAGRRLEAMLEMLYATGLRVSELVALPAAAVTRDRRFLVVRGKGGKERMVPLGVAAERALAAY